MAPLVLRTCTNPGCNDMGFTCFVDDGRTPHGQCDHFRSRREAERALGLDRSGTGSLFSQEQWDRENDQMSRTMRRYV